MTIKAPVYSVSQVNQYIKNWMDDDSALSALLIRGEISNYKCYPSGHHYFSLKDAESAIRCVMFKREAARLRFRPENGMKVLAFGRVTVFPRDGQYQLYCAELTPDGVGDLHVAFEQLKEKLLSEGLFDPSRKRPLPAYPQKIALVTSPAGAAVRDMLRILKARYPLAQVVVVPVRVQGEEAPGEIARAIGMVNALKLADLIIAGRGGGSMEDLWAFNEEAVARAIYSSNIPVISAVGHEPDVTISDFVADLRAATPSNAAELAVPDQMELREAICHLTRRLGNAAERLLASERTRLNHLCQSRALAQPRAVADERRMLLDNRTERFIQALNVTIERSRVRTAKAAAQLNALSPLAVLGRGYAIVQKENGEVLRSAGDAEAGENLTVRLTDGVLTCSVKKKGSAGHGRETADI